MAAPLIVTLPDDVVRAAEKYLAVDRSKQAANFATLNLAAYIGERVIALIVAAKAPDEVLLSPAIGGIAPNGVVLNITPATDKEPK